MRIPPGCTIGARGFFVWLGLATLAVGAVFFAGQNPSLAQEGWQAGVAAVKITPEPGLWMAGFAARDQAAQGTLQDLWAKALVLQDAKGRKALLVSADFLGFTRSLGEYLCTEIQRRWQIPRERIMLCCTHTHSGPVIEGALYDIYPLDDAQREKISRYTRWLEGKLVEAVESAMARLEPVALYAGEGTATFAVNRRNNREADVVKLREEGKPLAGPSDYRVPVLAVRRADGSLKAVVFHYACHTTVLSLYQWHGDYAGCAQLELEKRYPGATAIFCIGCGADQNALPRRTVELAEQYGQQLAQAVAAVLDGQMRAVPPRLEAHFELIRLDYEVVDRPTLEAAASQSTYVARWARRLLAALDRGESFPNWYPYPVQVWLLGDNQWWIALGGEVVVDYALRLGELYGSSTWVTGYTNDVMAYIPSRRVWQEGGYESGAFSVYGLPAKRWSEDIETRILAAVARGMEACRTKLAQP
ncbi:MAG: neutral/alkaline non-lysosomal ceramidase N-terminal domain-containing protein [Thermoguttaceae bacterium]|nr:neutral/alkaline non-lysosomal ceramidase N-terminal domain-containing protein [Thermoguttaceae bacterium]MDW8079414.1 neutral/alkaline non-lysosomal ceramidase N-terminal domain-containing protein [Thermoguttaceae bacterium]